MSHYDGDSWSNHELNEVKCAECEEYFDDQEREGNICPPCIEKEGEAMKEYGYYVEGDGLICLQCGDNPLYDGVLTRAEAEGYPDGFTCADCGTVVEGESK